MTTDEAMDYLKKMHEDAASQTAEPVSTEGVVADTGDLPTNSEQAPVPESDAEVGSEPTNAEVSETVTDQTEVPTEKSHKKNPTKQEKINHAFQREKARHREQLDAANKRIAELEERLNKYSQLEQGDFDPNDVKGYIDHKIALNAEQNELEALKRGRDRIIAADRIQEAGDRHSKQVNDCFGSDEEREHYWNLLRNGGTKFREFLNEHDVDENGEYSATIDKFIGDSPIAPLMISTLMRNPDTLRSIVEMRSPMRKMLALQQLENRLTLARKVGISRQNQGTQQQQKPRRSLPILGSQVANPSSTSESTQRDWNRYLEEHPRS